MSCDFSSVEMRVAAALTGDPTLRRLYAEGGDPYWLLARMAYGDRATKEQRGQVKGFVLGRMYGGGIATLSRNQGWSEQQGQHLVQVLDDAFPFIKKLNYELRDQVKRDPMWTNEFGRLQVCEKSSSHTVLNYRIQGLARDLLAQAMFRVEDAGLAEFMLLPIHDELLVQFPDDEVSELTMKLQEAMYFQLPISPLAPVWNDQAALQRAADLLGFVEIPAEAVVLGKRWIAK